jgi:ATP-dependent RNA helicase DeaD
MHVSPEPAAAAVADQFRRAGFRALTPLQQRLVPLVFRGRDAAVETAPGSGATAAAVYTLIIGHRGKAPAPVGGAAAPLGLLLAADADDAAQAAREWTRFSRALGRAPSFVALDEKEDARREARRLTAGAAVVAGTPARIIDNLRRGTLRLEARETLVVSLPEGEARESSIRDVQFVLEKSPSRRQTVVLGRPPLAGHDEVLALAHHPEIVAAGAVATAPAAGVSGELLTVEGERDVALVRLLLARPPEPALVLHGGRPGADRALRRLREVGVRAEALAAGTGPAARRRAIAALAAGTLDALLVPLPVGEDLDLDEAAVVVWLDLPQPRDARRALPARGRLVALAGADQAKDIARIQETTGVTMKTIEAPGDADVLGGALDRIVSRMAEEDPAELARLVALVRRRVPLLRRTQFAAFLLKDRLPRLPGRPAEASPGADRVPAPPRGDGRREPREGRRDAREGREGREGRGEGRRAEREGREGRGEIRRSERASGGGRAEGSSGHGRETAPGFTLLFVNAGRNRRVFARDLTAVFVERLGLAEGEIGSVRVFDKYSFVEIVSARAAAAVERVTGAEVKGRTINVEIAKRKEENPAR